jgi:hypothetical protein
MTLRLVGWHDHWYQWVGHSYRVGSLFILEPAVGRTQVRYFWTPWQGANHSHS